MRKFQRRFRLGDFGPGTLQLHDRLYDWVARVVANGGSTPSIQTQLALSNFYYSLDALGLTSKMWDVSIVPSDGLIAVQTPIFLTYGNPMWTNSNFVSGDLNANGLVGNGTNKVMQTGITLPTNMMGNGPTAYPGITLYVYEGADGNTCEFSWIQNNFSLYVAFGGTAFFDCYATGAGRISAANANWKGFISGNRLDAAHSSIYLASSLHAFSTLATTAANNTVAAVSTSNCSAWANFTGSAATQFSNKRMSFVSWHQGLSSTDAQNFYNAIQVLRTQMGGGFI